MKIPKELLEKLYGAIEIARADGTIKAGYNEVRRSLEDESSRLAIIASDFRPQKKMLYLKLLAEEKKIPLFEVPDQKNLGKSVGIYTGTSAVSIIKPGRAQNLFEEVGQSALSESGNNSNDV